MRATPATCRRCTHVVSVTDTANPTARRSSVPGRSRQHAHLAGRQSEDDVEQAAGEPQPECPARAGEQHAFHRRVAQQARAAGADCRHQRELTAAARRAHQHQVATFTQATSNSTVDGAEQQVQRIRAASSQTHRQRLVGHERLPLRQAPDDCSDPESVLRRSSTCARVTPVFRITTSWTRERKSSRRC